MIHYPNLLAVRNFCGATGWEHLFLTKANEVLSSIKLEDGMLALDSVLVGRYRFIQFEEARTNFSHKPWFPILLQREYQVLGTIHGFLNWEWYDGWPYGAYKLDTIRDWLYLSHGLLAQSGSDQFYHGAVKHTYSLAHLTQKHGFESGLAFFDDAYNNGKHEQYLQYLRQLVIDQLKETGVKYDPLWSITLRIIRFDYRSSRAHCMP